MFPLSNASKKITILLTFLFFFVWPSLFSQDRSGVIRGGFVVDGSRNSNAGGNQSANPPQSGDNAQAESRQTGQGRASNENQQPQTALSSGQETENANQGSLRGSITAGGNASTNIKKPKNALRENQASASGPAKKKKDDIDYKKIYFLIGCAVILFLYLIFGMKKKSRKVRSGGSASNRYF